MISSLYDSHSLCFTIEINSDASQTHVDKATFLFWGDYRRVIRRWAEFIVQKLSTVLHL